MKKITIVIAALISMASCTKDESVTPSTVDTLDWKLTMHAPEFGINIDNMSPTDVGIISSFSWETRDNEQYGTQFTYQVGTVTVCIHYYWSDGSVWIMGSLNGRGFNMVNQGYINICSTAAHVYTPYKLVDYTGRVRSAYENQ